MRVPIDLGAELNALAIRKAGDLGISTAEYIRGLVEQDLAQPDPNSNTSVVFGLGDSGGSDIAVDRKAATAEAIGARNKQG